MPTLDLNRVANIISILSGLMTICGFGGVISWTFLKRDRGVLESTIMAIFALSIKTAICLLIFAMMAAVGFYPYLIILAFLRGGAPGGDIFWDSFNPIPNILSYCVVLAFMGPFYLLVCLSLYTMSFWPFIQFFKVFLRAGRKKKKA